MIDGKERDAMKRLRDKFHLWAFGVQYRALADEEPTVRFRHAIIRSSPKVPDKMILAWAMAIRELRDLDAARRKIPIKARPSKAEYWRDVGAIIQRHTGQACKLRAWELDRLVEVVEAETVEVPERSEGIA